VWRGWANARSGSFFLDFFFVSFFCIKGKRKKTTPKTKEAPYETTVKAKVLCYFKRFVVGNYYSLDAKKPKNQGCRKMTKIYFIPLQRMSLKPGNNNTFE
jgi:hypothetical protein